MDPRVLKGSKKTNAERAIHRARAKSALSRYTKRHPTKPVVKNTVEERYARLPLPLPPAKTKPIETLYKAPYPKTHIPKKTPVRNTTLAKERAQRVANQMTRRLRLSKRKPSGVFSRAEARRRVSISQRQEIKEAKRASESAIERRKFHESILPEESHSASRSDDFFDRT